MSTVAFRTSALVAGLFATLALPVALSAQTTVTLSTPDQHVFDATVGAGNAASATYDSASLTVRSSSDVNLTRRSFMKFDTENTIPARTAITSATLSLVVRGAGGAATRRIGVYDISTSFDEPAVTWGRRKVSYAWVSAGGDLATMIGEIAVPATPGAVVTLNLTSYVQWRINQPAGVSRYTRLAFVDLDAPDATSFRDFHSSEATDPAQRPRLAIVYGQVAAPPPPAPAPPPTPTTVTSLRVLHWNLHHGVDTAGAYNLTRQMQVIASLNPDIISLNEVEKNNRSYGNEDQAARIAQYLTSTTGQTWSYYMRPGSGATSGIGNAVFSRFPLVSSSFCQLSSTRNAVQMTTVINGRTFNIWSTHLAVESSSWRISETNALLACMAPLAEQKIVAGDFNAAATTSEVRLMTAGHVDAWPAAKAVGAALNYPGNGDGATRNTRIDYVFSSRAATALTLRSAQIYDTRNASGVMPSDHKPMVVTYEVR